MFGWWGKFKRSRLADRPFPAVWREHLRANVPFYEALSEEARPTFEENLKVFLLDKHFIGAHDLEVTEEMKVTISAAAVRLIQNLDLSYYDRLTEIVVYPFDYRHEGKEGVVLGEAHTWGTVVLSWPAVQRGLKNPNDGHETATHEFAHVLDVMDGAFDGTPQLQAKEQYHAWAAVMTEHFIRLRKRRRKNVLRNYGATNEAEFFAVATEAFFEKPKRLEKEQPELFEVLQRFYGETE